MNDEIQVLNPSVITELLDMLKWWQNRKQEIKPRPSDPLWNTPDILLARAPRTGIPARQDDPGSGSPGSGTGTDSSIADPFFAMCRCFYIDDSVSSDTDIFYTHQDLPVWNYGKVAIAPHAPIIAVKDKTGKWIAMDPAGSGSGGLWIKFALATTLHKSNDHQDNCSVMEYWGGGNPGSTVTVWNLQGSGTGTADYVFSGAPGHVGYAVYDADHAKFKILQMECP